MSYELYEQHKKDYIQENKDLIEKINKNNIPQNILMAKNVYSEMKDVKSYTGEMEFGFSEAMVNKLMTFAFMKGSCEIEEKSYKEGYNKAREEILNFLGVE